MPRNARAMGGAFTLVVAFVLVGCADDTDVQRDGGGDARDAATIDVAADSGGFGPDAGGDGAVDVAGRRDVPGADADAIGLDGAADGTGLDGAADAQTRDSTVDMPSGGSDTGADLAMDAGAVDGAVADSGIADGGGGDAGCAGCLIGGTCYAKGASNPSDVCQQCDPATSTTAWRSYRPCVKTVAGSTGGFADGPALSAKFNMPQDLAVDSAGDIYVADDSNNRVRKISGGLVSTFAGDGTSGTRDGPATTARFRGPDGIAVVSGKLYVADAASERIRLISGGVVSTLAGDGTMGYKDGPAASAAFQDPRGLAVDSSGRVYVADTKNSVIRLVSGGQVSTFAGSTAGLADGPALQAKFSGPFNVAVDSSGKVYVSDTGNKRIRVISGGQVSTLAGTVGTGLSAPLGIAVDSAGRVYIAGYGSNKIWMVSGGKMTVLAGATGLAYVDGPALSAHFSRPSGVAVGTAGEVYVADSGNNVIRVILQ